MLHGVIINGVDTLTQYGLCMLADYTIQSPSLRENRITIPGVDGSIDVSTALTGQPVYNDRSISFTLFKRTTDEELNEIRRQLMDLYHGQNVTVQFPFDSEHNFNGKLQFGDMSGCGIIPCVMLANPWRLKTCDTTVTRSDLSTSYKTIVLNNSRKPVTPTITCGQRTTIEFKGKTYSIGENVAYKNLDIVLDPGANELKAKVASGTGTISIEYREGSL